MWPPLVRCLVVLLALALANGNAHAMLRLGSAQSEPCPDEHAHHHGGMLSDHQHLPNKGFACCCDCLGCSSAACLLPNLSTAPAELASSIHYDGFTMPLCGRALLPEPDPPRPGTLS
jgi:hypothetical protein